MLGSEGAAVIEAVGPGVDRLAIGDRVQAIGAPAGTRRLSFGPFNRDDDVDAIVAAVADVTDG